MAVSIKHLYSNFVGQLPVAVTENEVVDLFSRCGLIQDLYISSEVKNGSKYGFIRYSTPEEVIKAVSQLHRIKLKENRIIVDYASDTVDRIKRYQESEKKKSSNDKENQGSIPNVSNRNSTESNVTNRTVTADNYFSLFVGFIHPDVKEEELRDIFSSCGFVQDFFIFPGKSSGSNCGIIRYSSREEVIKAKNTLNGVKIRGTSIVVDFARDTLDRIQDKSLLKNENLKESMQSKDVSPKRNSRKRTCSVYVGNLHTDVKEEDVRELFKGCGDVRDCFLRPSQDQETQFGFVSYSTHKEISNAIYQLNGWKIKKKPIVVDYANDSRYLQYENARRCNAVPSVKPVNNDNDEKSTMSNEIQCIVNRSRIQETCTSLQLTCLKGSRDFRFIMQRLDKLDKTHKTCSAFRTCPSELNHLTNDYSKMKAMMDEQPQTVYHRFTAEFREVMNALDGFMYESNSQQKSSDWRSKKTPVNGSSISVNGKNFHEMKSVIGSNVETNPKESQHVCEELPCTNDQLSVSGNIPSSVNSVSYTSQSLNDCNRLYKNITHSDSVQEDKVYCQRFDKQKGDEDLGHVPFKLIEEKRRVLSDTVGDDDDEFWASPSPVVKEKEAASWVTDLFCKILDSQSNVKASESETILTSSEYSPVSTTSGYESYENSATSNEKSKLIQRKGQLKRIRVRCD